MPICGSPGVTHIQIQTAGIAHAKVICVGYQALINSLYE